MMQMLWETCRGAILANEASERHLLGTPSFHCNGFSFLTNEKVTLLKSTLTLLLTSTSKDVSHLAESLQGRLYCKHSDAGNSVFPDFQAQTPAGP